MKEYLVKSKDYEIKVIADNTMEAFVLFFKSVIENNVSLSKLGHLATIEDEGETYGIRTAPILVNLGCLDAEQAISGISILLGVSTREAEEVLEKCMKDDKWVSDRILNN